MTVEAFAFIAGVLTGASLGAAAVAIVAAIPVRPRYRRTENP